ncbi:hypothetical protein [Amycolatopsis australiensis]|uniref:Uncharacterized protein n=1 Tax=Amycolatopsis australiensis TaxID=546364 RepID=A0A1K1LLH1_9PSEU|nr:hypothetical protein [Amycolatopsis australiensis]SFW11740.1 hypothetical protein SAMN04489730_0053 [Amycolatopsis australiensis]
MLLLFCLLIGYGVIRLWEDTTARWRNETPPRHEHRMERMRQRAAAGAPPPASGLRRYVAGLADDVWSSAHEKRQLMDDARRIKREEKAKRKAAKIIARQRAKTDKALGFSAAVPNDTATPADTAAPAAEPLPPAATAAGTPVSPAGTPSADAANDVPAAGDPAPAAAGRAEEPAPIGFFAAVPQADSGTPPPQRSPLPQRTPRTTPPEAWTSPGTHRSGAPASPGTATRARARELAPDVAARAESPEVAAATSGAPYPMTAEQSEIYHRAMAGVTGPGIGRVTMQELNTLPLTARADLLDIVRRTPGAGLTVVPGLEDVDALAVLARRHGDQLDIADIYRHYEDASPQVQALVEQEMQAAARSGAGTMPAAPTTSASGEPAQPTDHGSASSADPEPGTGKENNDLAAAAPEPSAPAESSNVIPFPSVNPHAAQFAAGKEYPIVNGEITGLDQAIQYAGDLVDYCTRAHDGIVAAAPDPDALAQSCEQANADLDRGGVRGETLTSVAEVQESVVAAARAVNEALAQWEAAQAAAQKLHTGLSQQTSVQEAYAATPDAGSREFVTNGV